MGVLASPPIKTRSKNANLNTRSCTHSLSGQSDGGALGPTSSSQHFGTLKVSKEKAMPTRCVDSKRTSPLDVVVRMS